MGADALHYFVFLLANPSLALMQCMLQTKICQMTGRADTALIFGRARHFVRAVHQICGGQRTARPARIPKTRTLPDMESV